MSKYYLDESNQFMIENYDKTKTFASFMPGVAGLDGIPMWVYYVNRGQLISGFGLENKENPIMDFVPANIAYRRTELHGFRTFIKINNQVHEIFSSNTQDDVARKMIIDTNVLTIEEVNNTLKLKVTVRYYNISHEDYAGLVRKVTFTNFSDKPQEIEVIDGLPTIWPAGANNYTIKNMANLAVAWIDVFNGEKNIPFYRNRSTTEDTAEVGEIEVGHYYLSVNQHNEFVPIIYDVDLIFGQNTSLIKPTIFEEENLAAILSKEQISANKLPCAFTAYKTSLVKEETIYSLVGRMNSLTFLNDKAQNFTTEYFRKQEQYAIDLGKELTHPVTCKTALKQFDSYVKQSFLDNLLRGGYPLVFKGKDGNIIYHVYSRIHGDMEREYNSFFVEPTFYSQGNGNYRDVNQNRRNDVYFVKEAGLYNIKQFMELIQLDGHNPLVIKGSSFMLDDESLKNVLTHVRTKQNLIEKVLKNKFTPGKLLKTITDYNIELDINNDEFVEKVLLHSSQEIEAEYGTGYWSDHWTYNMDLIDNYLNIYPDKIEQLMFEKTYRFFESPVSVLPRKDKYVLNKDGKVRQLEPIYFDHEKIKRLGLNQYGTNWSKDASGNVYKTTLYVKLLSLGLNKVAALDPYGMGVMMDADKPGWNDSMNGLPALFGSGLSETIETRRIIKFLLSINTNKMIEIPEEIYVFLNKVVKCIEKKAEDFIYFDEVQDVREAYREAIRFGLTGKEVTVSTDDLHDYLQLLDDQIDKAIIRAKEFGKGVLPTFLTFNAEEYILLNKNHPSSGLPNVKVTKWSARSLPLFLEAPARYLKQIDDVKEAKALYQFIQNSEMYDEKLKMYLTSESLEEETLEIGRSRAFTPGWLERESCFMHMEYKYLLGVLKSGLYDEFFKDIKTCLPPFMDPSVYGRSILENSSFIASSRNPNPFNHGRGFVARLTGTTSEMISLWLMMMMGKKLFSYVDDELNFTLNPILNSEFFDSNDEVSFLLLNATEVIYKNKKRKNTYGEDKVSPVSYKLLLNNNKEIVIQDKAIKGELAMAIRNGEVKQIIVELS